MKRHQFTLLAYLLYLSASLAGPVAVNKTSSPSGTQMVAIGDAGNQADELRHGRVEKNFLMGAYEWTVADWKEMLDNVASKIDPAYSIADPHELWNKGMSRWITRTKDPSGQYHYEIVPGAENLPITHVNFFDICRACNYMQNKGKLSSPEEFYAMSSITEYGAYNIMIYPGHIQEAKLTSYARYYIPTQDQWIKAAYYQGGSLNAGYFTYPTQHENNPGDREGPILENRVNYNLYCWNPWAPALQLSPVNYCGGFDDQGNAVGTRSAYGCFDMAGNVNEWVATQYDSTKDCLVMGGDYKSEYYNEPGVTNYLMRTCSPQYFDPNTRSDVIGFRMAAVEDASNIISPEHGFSEINNAGCWNNLTTGEQVAGITAAGIATAGVVIGAEIFWSLIAIETH